MEGTDSSSTRIFRQKLIYGVRNGLFFVFLMLFQTSFDAVKKLVQHLTIFSCLGGLCCTGSFENFSCSFIQNRCDKFYSHIGIAIKVHLLVIRVW